MEHCRHLPLPVLMLVTEPVTLDSITDKTAANNNEITLAPFKRFGEIVKAAISGGVNIVQIRDKTGTAADQFRSGHFAFNELPRRRKALLFVNCYDNPTANVAYVLHANGLHIPEQEETLLRRALKPDRHRFVGTSVHSVESARKAATEGVDYIIAGTIYESQSHPGEPGQGIDYLQDVCAAVAPLPVIAIGGITPERVGECIAEGAAGVAVLSPIMRADDPRAVAARYREELDKAWSLRSTEKA